MCGRVYTVVAAFFRRSAINWSIHYDKCPNLSIVTPDGKATPVKLTGPRMALGRAATNELSFPGG